MLRVDTIPFWLKPFYLLWAYATAAISHALMRLWAITLRFKWVDEANMSISPNNIYCIWHTNLIIAFMLSFKKPATRRNVWMNHPAWFMKPIHIILYWKGVHKLVLGSSGNSGREAREGVEEYLRQGYSTCMAVDGPAGPIFVMKPGAMQMALNSRVPIIGLEFIANKKWILPTWDKKVLPVPFSTVTIKVNGPYYVTNENYAEVEKEVVKGLG